MKSWCMCIVWHRQGQACPSGWQSLLWVGFRGMVRTSSGLSGNFDNVWKTYILGPSLLPWHLQPEDCFWYWECFYLDKVKPLPFPPCSAVYNKGAGLLGCWASSVRESGPDASFFFFKDMWSRVQISQGKKKKRMAPALYEPQGVWGLPSTVCSYRLRLWKEQRMGRRERCSFDHNLKETVTVLGSGKGRGPIKKRKTRVVTREMQKN